MIKNLDLSKTKFKFFLSFLKLINRKSLVYILAGYFILTFVVETFIPIKVISRLLFLLFLGCFSFTLFYVSKERVLKFLTLEFNRPKMFVWARILYAAFGIYAGVQHFMLIPSGLEPVNNIFFNIENIELIYAINIVYLLAHVGLLFGKFIRVSWILIYVAGGLTIPYALELFLKSVVNFYAIFIPVNLWKGKTVEYKGNGAAVLLMTLSMGLLISCAGFFKLADPVWMEGLGMYYSLNIPFFFPEVLWPLLEYEWLVVSANYFAIVVQTISFPFLLFRKTRWIGIMSIVIMGVFLTFGMFGIGMAGGPIFLSITPLLLSFILPKRKGAENIKSITEYPSLPKIKKVFVLVFFWWAITGFYRAFSSKFEDTFSYIIPKYGSYVIKSEKRELIPKPLYWRNEIFKTIVSFTRPPMQVYESTWIIPLFDYYHLFDRYFYKVEFQSFNGKVYEPRKFFKENGAFSDEYPLPLNERFLFQCWEIQEVRQILDKESFNENARILKKTKDQFDYLIKYCEEVLEVPIDSIEKVTISIKPVHQPYKFEGNKKPWTNKKFSPFYIVNKKKGSHKFIYESLGGYDFRKLEVEPFQKGIIKPNYWKEL